MNKMLKLMALFFALGFSIVSASGYDLDNQDNASILDADVWGPAPRGTIKLDEEELDDASLNGAVVDDVAAVEDFVDVVIENSEKAATKKIDVEKDPVEIQDKKILEDDNGVGSAVEQDGVMNSCACDSCISCEDVPFCDDEESAVSV